MKMREGQIYQAKATLRKKVDSMKEKGIEFGKDNKYYEVDRGYDKGFYENDMANYFKIFVAFLAFYAFNIFHFWGVFELGIAESNVAMYYQIGVFSFTIFVGICMLISGSISNEIKSQHDFLCEQLDRKKQEEAEKEKIRKRAAALREKEQMHAAINAETKNLGEDQI